MKHIFSQTQVSNVDWPETRDDHPASAPWVQGLQTYITTYTYIFQLFKLRQFILIIKIFVKIYISMTQMKKISRWKIFLCVCVCIQDDELNRKYLESTRSKDTFIRDLFSIISHINVLKLCLLLFINIFSFESLFQNLIF